MSRKGVIVMLVLSRNGVTKYRESHRHDAIFSVLNCGVFHLKY